MGQVDEKKAESVAPASEASAETPPLKLRLTRPHPLISKTEFEHPLFDRHGSRRERSLDGADIQVSRPLFRTALCVMDRLFKAVEEAGFEVAAFADHRGSGTYALAGHDRTPLSLVEEFKKAEHVPTAKEVREKERTPFSSIPKWDHVPTGKLTLTPGGIVDLASEESLSRFIQKAVAEITARIAEERKRRETQQEVQRREWEKQRKAEEGKARVKAFHEAASALRKYRLLMDYIEEVRRFGRVPDDQRSEGQSMEDWIRWAEWQARKIHPLGF